MAQSNEHFHFLERFPKDASGLYVVYDRYTFDDLFRLLLKNGFDDEESLCFVLSNCSLSALVFPERFHNMRYMDLSPEDALHVALASRRARVIYDLWVSINS